MEILAAKGDYQVHEMASLRAFSWPPPCSYLRFLVSEFGFYWGERQLDHLLETRNPLGRRHASHVQ